MKRMLVLGMIVCLAWQAGRFATAADVPAWESLYGRIPELSSENAQLTAYRVTFLLPLPDSSVTLDWRRDTGRTGMLVSTDTSLTPSIFTSEKHGYVFDAITPGCIELEDASPRFSLQQNEKDDALSINFGVTNGRNVEAKADLRVLLKGYENFTASTHQSNGCKLHGVATTGRSEVTVYFSNPDSPYPSRIEIRSKPDGTLLLAAVGIELNNDVPFLWPEFPGLNAFDPPFDHVRKMQANDFLDVATTNAVPYVNAAIFHEELRVHPLVKKLGPIDWTTAKRNLDKYSRELQVRAKSDQLLLRIPKYFR